MLARHRSIRIYSVTPQRILTEKKPAFTGLILTVYLEALDLGTIQILL
jgi:hypothetical protein